MAGDMTVKRGWISPPAMLWKVTENEGLYMRWNRRKTQQMRRQKGVDCPAHLGQKMG